MVDYFLVLFQFHHSKAHRSDLSLVPANNQSFMLQDYSSNQSLMLQDNSSNQSLMLQDSLTAIFKFILPKANTDYKNLNQGGQLDYALFITFIRALEFQLIFHVTKYLLLILQVCFPIRVCVVLYYKICFYRVKYALLVYFFFFYAIYIPKRPN